MPVVQLTFQRTIGDSGSKAGEKCVKYGDLWADRLRIELLLYVMNHPIYFVISCLFMKQIAKLPSYGVEM